MDITDSQPDANSQNANLQPGTAPQNQNQNLDLPKTIEEMLDKRGIGKDDIRRPVLLAEIEERAGIVTAQTLMYSLDDSQKVEFLKILTSNDADAESKITELIAGISGLQQAVNKAIQAEIAKIMDKPL